MKLKNNMFVRVLSVLSIFMLLFNTMPIVSNAAAHDPNDDTYDYELRFWEDKQPDLGFYINAAARYTLETVIEPSMGSTSGEWSVMNLLRGMYTGYDYLNDIDDDYFEDYLERIEDYVVDKNGNLDRNKSTEWSRLILALSALDYDITDVAGYDFIEKLSESHRFSYRQGINGPIWEIIAMNTGEYEFYPDENPDVNTYGKMIDYILDREIEQSDGTIGGWALANFGGTQPDPDITGMALQALAPYYKNEELYNQTDAETSYDQFIKAVERGISILADIQAENGAFKAFGNVNAESTVQVIVALTALGIDPLSDNIELSSINENVSFLTDGEKQDGVDTDNMIDALLTFWAGGSGSEPGVGGFKHVTSGHDGGGGSGFGVNAMATDQSLYGLIAYDRFLKGENPLYDMTDMMSGKGGKSYTEYQAKKLNVSFVGLEEEQTDKKSPYGIVDIIEGTSKDGKEFLSWNSKADGSGTTYYPGEKLSMPNHNITLFAQFENIEYSITYETNGGAFVRDDIETTYTIDDNIILPIASDVEKEGYTFVGWYENNEFEGKAITSIPFGSYGDKVFYAKWKEVIDVDHEAIKTVESMIDNLPDVEELSLIDQNSVTEARKAYDNLTKDEQQLVSNIEKLILLELKLEELSDGLSITTNLEDNFITKADMLTFDIWAKDKDGKKINPSDIAVTNNGKDVSVNWDDSEKTSYTLNLELGSNNVKIVVKDNYVLEYNIVREFAEDGDVIGTYVFSLEAFTIGIGHIIEPVELDIIKGENAAEALLSALDEYGFQYDHWAFPSFYLAYIIDGENTNIYKTEPKIPQVLKEALNGNYNEKGYWPGELGEFDFNALSGWMYAVNNMFPNVGFADYYLSDGDVMRVQFTLALGSDLGGGMGDDLFEIANKDNLTKKIAEINSSDQKEEYLSIDLQRDAYENAINILHKVNASQSETDNAFNQIKKAEAETAANLEAARKVTEQIAALPLVSELTLDDKQAVENARSAYEMLTKTQQAFVENINHLELLEERILELEKDQKAANIVESKIKDLPTVEELTLEDQKAVENVRAAYEELTETQKELVPNVDKLIALEKKIADLIDRESSPAQRVENLIKELPNIADVTLDNKRDVEIARLAYRALIADQQEEVSNIQKLKDLEIELDKQQSDFDVEKTDEIADDIKELARKFLGIQTFSLTSKQTDSIPSETKELIEKVRSAFYSLTPEQLSLIEYKVKDIFIQIEEKMFELEEKTDDEISVNRIEMAISGLPEPEALNPISDVDWVASVREQFNDLTDDQKVLVSNRHKLDALDNQLKQNEEHYAKESELNKVIADISELPTETEITLNDKEQVATVRKAFDQLSVEQQERVTNYQKLTKLESRLKELEVKEQEDYAAAEEVEELINSLPDIDSLTLEDKNAVLAAKAAFYALTEDQKQHLTNIDTLINTLNSLLEKINIMEAERDSVDKSNLESILEKAKNANLTNKTVESIATLEKAIKEGELILSNPNVDQEEIDNAIKAIENALASLQQKRDPGTPGSKTDKDESQGTHKGSGSDNMSSGENNKVNSDQSGKLPSTATNTFNYMMVGLLLIILGAMLFVRRVKTYK